MKIKKIYWVLKTKFLLLSGIKIGWFSYIAKPAYLFGKRRMKIGNRVRIFPGARIEVMRGGELIIEDNVSIGPNLNITVARKVLIKEGTTISANVFITDMSHDTSEKDKSVMETNNIVSDGTCVGNFCFIGAGVVLLAGSVIGDNVVIGANSVVSGLLKSNSVYAGLPAKFIKKRYDS